MNYTKLINEELSKHECSVFHNPGGIGVEFKQYGHYQLLSSNEPTTEKTLLNLKKFIKGAMNEQSRPN